MTYFVTGRNNDASEFSMYYSNEIDMRIDIKTICESNKELFLELLAYGIGNTEQVNAVCNAPIDFDDKNLLNVFDKVIQVNRLCIDTGRGDRIHYILRCSDGHIFDFTQ